MRDRALIKNSGTTILLMQSVSNLNIDNLREQVKSISGYKSSLAWKHLKISTMAAAILIVAACSSKDQSIQKSRNQLQSHLFINPGAVQEIDLEHAASNRQPWALLELGRRYEEGDRMPTNFVAAARLYREVLRIAATKSIYRPPLSVGGRGGMVSITENMPLRTLNEARRRLGRMYIEGNGVAVDAAKGRALIAIAESEK